MPSIVTMCIVIFLIYLIGAIIYGIHDKHQREYRRENGLPPKKEPTIIWTLQFTNDHRDHQSKRHRR